MGQKQKTEKKKKEERERERRERLNDGNNNGQARMAHASRLGQFLCHLTCDSQLEKNI